MPGTDHGAVNPRVFCFPYAGGGKAIFRSWSGEIPGAEVCPVELPGRGSMRHEAAFRRIPALADFLFARLTPDLDRPVALFGHSMGAIIAFEIAHRLQRSGRVGLIGLIASGCQAPHDFGHVPPLHELPRAAAIAELRRLRGTPQEALDDPELMDLILPTLVADFEACHTYACERRPPLACPIAVIGGSDDPEVGVGSLGAWRGYTTAAFSANVVPGGHFFMDTARLQVLSIVENFLKTSFRNGGG